MHRPRNAGKNDKRMDEKMSHGTGTVKGTWRFRERETMMGRGMCKAMSYGTIEMIYGMRTCGGKLENACVAHG